MHFSDIKGRESLHYNTCIYIPSPNQKRIRPTNEIIMMKINDDETYDEIAMKIVSKCLAQVNLHIQ